VHVIETFYTPQGRFIGIPPLITDTTDSSADGDAGEIWWRDSKYCIGSLSSKTRNIRVVNTLTHDEHTIEVRSCHQHTLMQQVCSEESLSEIQDRYLEYNAHAVCVVCLPRTIVIVLLGFLHLETYGQSSRYELDTCWEWRGWWYVATQLCQYPSTAHNVVESDSFETLSLDEEFYVPALHLYFNDDLTVA